MPGDVISTKILCLLKENIAYQGSSWAPTIGRSDNFFFWGGGGGGESHFSLVNIWGEISATMGTICPCGPLA